jgi:anti-anti-sigma factor
MEITRTRTGDVVDVGLAGRLDGYWCDHLHAALTEVLREGNHHIRIDCSQVSYLTSAGIGVLMQFHKELGRINGTFHVVNPSSPVSAVLRITRVDTYLVAPAGDATPAPVRERVARRLEHEGVAFDVFDLDTIATLTCRTIGTAAPLTTGAFEEHHCSSFETMTPTLAIGIGAFGGSFSDCRARFGEMLSVAGATAYQPGDGTNVADYLVADGAGFGADVRVLYCLACEGRFSHLVRFEPIQAGGAIGLSRLLAGCFEASAAESLGIVVVAEASGLVGAALRRSPTERFEAGHFFAHPAVRARLSFTAERAFSRSVVLAAGVVTRNDRVVRQPEGQLRPIGANLAGHFHAAAFRFRPVRKGAIELGETVTGLFEPEQLLGVLHLLYDDRTIAGAGESEFVRGACWIGPIAGRWPVD